MTYLYWYTKFKKSLKPVFETKEYQGDQVPSGVFPFNCFTINNQLLLFQTFLLKKKILWFNLEDLKSNRSYTWVLKEAQIGILSYLNSDVRQFNKKKKKKKKCILFFMQVLKLLAHSSGYAMKYHYNFPIMFTEGLRCIKFASSIRQTNCRLRVHRYYTKF